MNAIMVVFIPRRNGQRLTEQPALVSNGEIASRSLTLIDGRERLAEPFQQPPPYWTWFVENPRDCGV